MPYPKLEGAQVLVTGGAGFIGAHLVEELLRQGSKVRVFDNLSTGLASNLDAVRDQIHMLEGDLRNVENCKEACDGVEMVFHQAALGSVPRSVNDPATSMAVNVGGTTNLFAAARDAGVRRVVYASSSSVYGDTPTLPKKEGEEGDVLSPYALSKKMCEELTEIFQRCYDMEIVGLRYFNVYGPRQRPDGPYAAVIPRFFDAYYSGGAPVIYGDGEQSRDFTYVGDAVRANILAAGAPKSACGRSYNVAGGKRVSLNQLWQLIRDLVGGGPEPEYTDPRPGDVRHSLADLSDSTAALEFEPQVGVDEGLKAAAAHYSAASTE